MAESRVKFDEGKAKIVRALAGYGVPQEDIAATIGCCVETMQKLYKKEISKGRAAANSQIGKRLFDKAMEGDVSALIFWATCRMRWRTEDSKSEKPETEDTAKKTLEAIRQAFKSVG